MAEFSLRYHRLPTGAWEVHSSMRMPEDKLSTVNDDYERAALIVGAFFHGVFGRPWNYRQDGYVLTPVRDMENASVFDAIGPHSSYLFEIKGPFRLTGPW